MNARAEEEDLNLQVVKWDNTVLGKSENLRSQAEELIFSGVAGETYYVKVVQAGTKDFNQYRLGLEKVPMATLKLAMGMDTGSSDSDGITQKNRPMLEGTGPVGSVLRLYSQLLVTGAVTTQPEVLLGSVTVGSTGDWKIQSPELADGRYALSAKMVLLNGTEQRISEARELTIDTLRPNLTIDGIYDGVAYELEGTNTNLTKTFSGTISDADAGVAVNFVQNQATQALSVATGIVGGAVTLAGKSFVEETLTFNAIDRAGNSQELSYRAMLIKLDDLTDESVLLPDVLPGLDDRTVPPNTGGNYVPTDLGGGQIYVGQGGTWGYSGGGGTGGSPGWQPPSGGTGASGGDPLLPVSDPALNQMLGYLPALRIILTTARDVLSKHPKTAAKKEALRQDLEMLMEVGRMVETGNLYNAMKPMLYGALSNGGITRRAAILKGWDLAKSLAKDAVLTKVQIAHTNLFGVSLVAMARNNVTVDPVQLRTVTENLVKSYARLNPGTHSDDGYASSSTSASIYSGASFLDAVWRMGASAVKYRAAKGDGTYEKNIIQFAVGDLEAQTKGSIDVLEALKVSDRMLQVVPRVSQLTQDSYGYQYASDTGYYNFVWGTKQASYKTAGFLDKLMDFGFEIARSNPTVTTGLNSSAEWVDTLWEGKTTWTNKEKESVAIGMSDWMDGFRLKVTQPVTNNINTLWSDWWVKIRDNRVLSEKAFDYAGRLMQASRAIGDAEVKKADFLSHLVNLGGAYAAINLNSGSQTGLFLDTLWKSSTNSPAIQELGDFVARLKNTSSPKEGLSFLKRVSWGLQQNQSDGPWDASEVTSALSISYNYYESVKSGVSVQSSSGFLEKAYQSNSRFEINSASKLLSVLPSNPTTPGQEETPVVLGNDIIAVNDRPSDDILNKIKARYDNLVSEARKSGYNEAADNLDRFLKGNDSQKYVEYDWLNKFSSFRDAVESARSKLIGDLAAKARLQLANFTGEGLETLSRPIMRYGEYTSRDVLRSGGSELLLASGAGSVQGLIDKINTSRITGGGFGNSYAVRVSANIEYYWFDDYNWNPNGTLDLRFKGLGVFYDDEANLLVKYRGAKPFPLYSGWDQEQSVQYSPGRRLGNFVLSFSPQSQPSLKRDRYIFGLHAPWEQADIDKARVIGKY
jgi:Bacterial Ig-like domain